MLTEVALFRPRSRKIEATVSHLVPKTVVNALEERLGVEAANKVETTIRSMKRNEMSMAQISIGDRRVRIKLGD